MAGEARDRPPPRSIRTSGSRPAPGRSRWTGRNCGSSSSGESTSQRTRSAGERLQSRRHQVALTAIGQSPVPGAGGRRRRLAHGLEVVGRPVAKGSAVPDGRPSARRVHRPAGGFRIPLSVFDFHERYPAFCRDRRRALDCGRESVRPRESEIQPTPDSGRGPESAASPEPIAAETSTESRLRSRFASLHRWERSTPAETTIGRSRAAIGPRCGSRARPQRRLARNPGPATRSGEPS